MSDDQIKHGADVPPSSTTENSGPAQEPAPEPEEFTIPDEEWKTFLSELEEHQTSQTQCNPDSEGLGAIPVGGVAVIGYVDEVNGEGGEEVPAVVPTRHELIQLVKYWTKDALDVELISFLYQMSGSTEYRLRLFALRRIDRIADAVGADEVNKAIRDVTDEYGQKIDRAHWIIFRYGNNEEREAYRDSDTPTAPSFQVQPAVAEELTSKVVARIFREGTPQKQEELLKEELRRYSTRLFSYKAEGGHFIELFGIDFPCELKSLVLRTGVDDPNPDPDSNTFFKLSIQQGKAILAALNEVAAKGEEALKALVQGQRSKGSKAA